MKIYGYCRISTQKQSIERQERNILSVYPDAIIRKEAYTGTKIEGRKELEKILKAVKSEDTIVFDSVSRMSRNADEGIELYMELLEKGVNLVFLKEPYINTETYKQAREKSIPLTGTAVDCILKGINEYLMTLAKEQIRIAFEQAQKEVDDLRQRTKEGLATATLNGKILGRQTGDKLNVKKAAPLKKEIREKLARGLTNTEIRKSMADKISINTFYKYLKEIAEEDK